MVHGEVRAPMLDLANRDLVESHLHAIWLAETGVKLAPSIAEILELGESGRPVRPTLMGDMRAAGVEKKAHPRMTAVLGALADEFELRKRTVVRRSRELRRGSDRERRAPLRACL